MSETTDDVYGAVAIEAYPTRILSPDHSLGWGARPISSHSAQRATGDMMRPWSAGAWQIISKNTLSNAIPDGAGKR